MRMSYHARVRVRNVDNFLLLDLAYSFRFYFQVFYTHPFRGVCVKNFEPGKMNADVRVICAHERKFCGGAQIFRA